MKENYLRWSEHPYAGERKPPSEGVTPYAGSWPLIFLKRDSDGHFLDPNYKKIVLSIKDPHYIDFHRELKIVQRTLNNLTPQQKKIGIYYGTGVPTKQWTPVIDKLIDTYGVGPTQAARILAVVQGAINDSMVVTWHLKYLWDAARPNQYDQTLETLLCTPRFPAYPSGHAVMSGCAEVMLTYFFPKEAGKIKRISKEDAISRLYAGVHFPSDNDEGLRLGRHIGKVIVSHLKRQSDERGQILDLSDSKYRNANILSEDYQQAIPFDFNERCLSLTRDADVGVKKNTEAAKPYLKF
ncbi:vanadium-dependent haloperoxidase [Bacillus infantis]|uniref:vanadium-dependent haloperoxidase n=1 Tax=Bacillus infantis TaxID=324767 RepID=UPI0030181978